jgi:hypothetical protein
LSRQRAANTYATSSALSGYLPLTGGTLTGALGGTSATFSGTLATSAGFSINANNGSLVIGPSSTRGVVNLGGTTDNFLTFANKGYIGVGSNYMQVLAQTGVALSLVSNASTVLSFALSSGAATFSSRVNVAGAVDDGSTALNVNGTGRFSGQLQSVASGGYLENSQLNVSISDASSSLSTVKSAVRFSNNGSGYITKIILSDNNISDCNLTYKPGTTGATNLFQIGVGTSTPQFTLNGSGVVTIANLAGTGSRAVLADAWGTLSAPVSDSSVKQNIQPLDYGIADIMKLKPVSFQYKKSYKNYGQGKQIGNIAQDMAKVIPEAVFTTPSTGKMGINYDQLNGVYIKALQELQEQINILKLEIQTLKNK